MTINKSRTVAYIDTLELFLRYLPRKIRTNLEKACGRRIRFEACKNELGSVWGFRIILHQPTKAVLSEAEKLQREHRATICRLDIAYDLPCTREWVEHHVTLRWRRAGPMYDQDNGFYFVRQQDRASRSDRDLLFYDDKSSKVTGQPNCSHIELRFQRSAAVKRAGLSQVQDLIKLDPRQLFEKHIRLTDFEPEPFKQAIIKASVRENRLRYQGKSTSDFVDKYRASISRFVRSRLERGLQDRVQLVKDRFPKHYAKLKSISVDVLQLPTALSWSNVDPKRKYQAKGS